jgi:hypothetical protein
METIGDRAARGVAAEERHARDKDRKEDGEMIALPVKALTATLSVRSGSRMIMLWRPKA